jgi:hypothetical protein
VVTGVGAAVAVTDAEVRRSFSLAVPADLLDSALTDGRFVRVAPEEGWPRSPLPATDPALQHARGRFRPGIPLGRLGRRRPRPYPVEVGPGGRRGDHL